MRGRWILVAVASLALARTPPAGAQERDALAGQVVERFMENYRVQAGLTPEQNTRFRTLARRSFQERREHERRERALWQALERQMRPGVAANQDSVTRLVDELAAGRVANAERVANDLKEFGTFLSPVQRAQLVISLERFQRNLEDIIRRRAGRIGGNQ